MPPKNSKPPVQGWRRWLRPETYDYQPRNASERVLKRIVVSVIGFTVVLIGIILIFTPGPAIVFIPAGLAILALEFAWARRWLRRMKAYTRLATQKARRKTKSKRSSPTWPTA